MPFGSVHCFYSKKAMGGTLLCNSYSTKMKIEENINNQSCKNKIVGKKDLKSTKSENMNKVNRKDHMMLTAQVASW